MHAHMAKAFKNFGKEMNNISHGCATISGLNFPTYGYL